MKGKKFIVGFSAFGFLLSLFSGFASVGNTFGRIIMHAFIFALVFALLAILINFVSTKFLSGDSDGSSDFSGGQPSSESTGSSHSVDIVVQDEELPAGENDSQFVVGPNRQMLVPDDAAEVKGEQGAADSDGGENPPAQTVSVSSVESAVRNANAAGSLSAAPADVANNGFVPVSLGETPVNVAGVEAKSHDDIKKEEKSSFPASPVPVLGSDEGELDSLPDLEDLSGYTVSAAPMLFQSDDSVEEGDYSETLSSSGISAEEVTDGKDAELMAKAISTLLAKE